MGKPFYLTGMGIANSMIGSSMILYPLNFYNYGATINIICVIIASGMLATTCKLLADNILPHQNEIAESIRRKCGDTIFFIFTISSLATLFLVSSVFFLLASDTFYAFFVQLIGPLEISQNVFKLIILGAYTPLIFPKSIDFVFKTTPFALSALLISTAVLVASVPMNSDNIDSGFWDIKVQSFKDVLAVASIISLSLMCHPTISPYIKANQPQKDNAKAVFLGYAIAVFIYLMVGVLGGMAIYKKPHQKAKPQNIIDYFSGQFQAPIIGALNFLYLFAIGPIFPYVVKNQLFEVVPQNKKKYFKGNKSSIMYAVLWVPTNVIFIFCEVSPGTVIAFIVTVVSFFIMYFIPIFMTVRDGDHFSDPPQTLASLLEGQESSSSTVIQNEKKAKPEKVVNEFKFVKLPIWKIILFCLMMLVALILMVSEFVSIFSPS